MMDLAAAQHPELLVVAHFDASDESSKDRQGSRAEQTLLLLPRDALVSFLAKFLPQYFNFEI